MSPTDAQSIVETFHDQRAFYQTNGRYELLKHRQRALDLLDAAIAELEPGS